MQGRKSKSFNGKTTQGTCSKFIELIQSNKLGILSSSSTPTGWDEL